MLYKTFKSNQPLITVLSIVFGLVIFSPLFFVSPVKTEASSTTSLLINFLSYFNSYPLGVIANIILVLLGSFLINKISEEHDLLTSNTHLLGLFFLILHLLTISTSFDINYAVELLLIFLWQQILRIYNQQNVFMFCFNSGLIIGCVLVLNPYLLFIPLLPILGLFIIRSPRVKDFILLFIGISLPLIYAISYLYLSDQIEKINFFFSSFQNSLHTFKLSLKQLFLFSLVAFSIIHLFLIYGKLTVRKRNLYLLIILSIPIFIANLLFIKNTAILVTIAILPSSILIARFIHDLKRNLFKEIITYLILFGGFVIMMVENGLIKF